MTLVGGASYLDRGSRLGQGGGEGGTHNYECENKSMKAEQQSTLLDLT